MSSLLQLLVAVSGICVLPLKTEKQETYVTVSGVASAISEGDIFIYSCSAQLISYEVDSISKEINCAEHEYMNMSSSLIALVTPLVTVSIKIIYYHVEFRE